MADQFWPYALIVLVSALALYVALRAYVGRVPRPPIVEWPPIIMAGLEAGGGGLEQPDYAMAYNHYLPVNYLQRADYFYFPIVDVAALPAAAEELPRMRMDPMRKRGH